MVNAGFISSTVVPYGRFRIHSVTSRVSQRRFPGFPSTVDWMLGKDISLSCQNKETMI